MLENIENNRSQKVLYILYVFLVFILIIFLRLFYLQVDQSSELQSKGERNFLKLEILNPPRGNFLDYNNNLLATNRPVFDLYWMGGGKFRLTDKEINVVRKVFDLLNASDSYETKLKMVGEAERFGKRVKIAEDIPFDRLCLINEQLFDANNLLISNRFRRFYPYRALASHVLGHLGGEGAEKFAGRYGLEKIFQDELEGERGYILYVINAMGRKLMQKEMRSAQAGSDVKLNLDLEMQKIAENSFCMDTAGALIVMDPENGAIRVLASFPTFDPNDFLSPISYEEWNDKFVQRSPFLNRAISALYPPASIFKLITFAAGLEEGVINKNSKHKCKGYIWFGGRKYNCIRRWGHGVLDCKDAIAYSCNIHCFEIAKLLKIDQLADYARRFGFGERTGFLIFDKSGLVPTTQWKMTYKREPWWKGETLSACIGQTYLLVTPLQVARMIAAIFEGYLVKPRLLEQEPVEKSELDIQVKTLEFLRSAMSDTVKHGTGSLLKYLTDFTISAKTGTAQRIGLEKTKIDENLLEHGWFASYFCYKNEKPLVLIVLVENAGTSRPALLVAQRFLESYGKMKEAKKLYD